MPGDHRKGSARSNCRAVRWQVESLESRELLSLAGSSRPGDVAHRAAALARQSAVVSTSAAGDVISVSPSAWKLAKRALAGSSVTVQHLPGADVPAGGDVVATGADLLRPRLVAILKAVYNSGQTVALTDATAAAAKRLQTLLGHPMPPKWPAGTKRVALVAFRQSQVNGQTNFSTDILPLRASTAKPPKSPGAAQAATQPLVASWLSSVFAATPTAPIPMAPTDTPQDNLLDLAASYTTSMIEYNNQNGNAVQVTDTVYDARSFQSQMDYYYVLQEVDYSNGTGASPWQAYTNSGVQNLKLELPTLLQTSPESTQPTTSVTSGVSETIGASVGFNEAQGFNVSLSASTTISNSKTFSFPSLEISNTSSLFGGDPEWSYTPTTQQPPGTLLTFYNQWIWAVPFSYYNPGQTDLNFQSIAYQKFQGQYSVPTTVQMPVSVPLPFGDTFQILKPTLTGVSQTTVQAGDTFNITGTGLYPSLVTGILIGGQPLLPQQYSTVSDTDIMVTAPDMTGTNLPVVVKTTQGFSNDNVDISIT